MSYNVTSEIGYIFVSLIIVALLYRAYIYLGNIETCSCAPREYTSNLKNIELTYMIVGLAGILLNVLYLIFHFNYEGMIKNNTSLLYAFVAYVLFMVGLYAYYIYNAIQFKRGLKPDCGCTNAWQNNIIYSHVLYLGLPIFMVMLGAMFEFKMNVNMLVLLGVVLSLIFLFENYLTRRSPIESFTSLMGPLNNSVFEPTLYFNHVRACGCKQTTANKAVEIDFSPKNGQPTQVYRQERPDEYPAPSREGEILIPMSTHERIVNTYRS